jgi:hypothetical protein
LLIRFGSQSVVRSDRDEPGGSIEVVEDVRQGAKPKIRGKLATIVETIQVAHLG